MKNMPSYKKVAIIVVSVGVLGLVLLGVLLNNNIANGDPIIAKYTEVLNDMAVDTYTYHATEETVVTDSAGTVLSTNSHEYFNDYDKFLEISYDESGEAYHYELATKEYNYTYWPCTELEEDFELYKGEGGAGYYARPLYSMSDTYFLITDKNVSYEENEEQYIVTYVDALKDRKGYWSNGETIQHICTSAISVCYFGKDWKPQKIVITEEWIVVAEDGAESKENHVTTITFLDTSEDEIKKRIDEEYALYESMLE